MLILSLVHNCETLCVLMPKVLPTRVVLILV
nr:MAG TPA: hypothetical protein [Crassvirales sp.]DAX07786.1 MAG TPA: hypothetical protein [Caudoviricetes sp.]